MHKTQILLGDLDSSDDIIRECLQHVKKVEDRCVLLRARSQNHWMRGQPTEAFNDILLALRMLGIDFNSSPTTWDIDTAIQRIRNEILSIGFSEILFIPRLINTKIELAIALLDDAGNPFYQLYIGASYSTFCRQECSLEL
jgi:hypothetical protein